VNLTVYAPGGPSADPTYNATMQYDDVIEIRIICSREGENHDDHLNDPTDDFPNDYAPMVITVNDKVVTVAPLITCTTLKNDTFYPHHHPCKSAQTIFVDDDWSNKDAKYTYQFEDWTDYDWNDINVSLYAVTNDIIKVEIRIEDREAAWKNPFSIEITPMDMTVEVYWNSTDYSESHNIMVYSGETADIELFAESNPCDTAFIKITPLIPPTASFVHSPSEPEEGQTVTFDASDSTSNVGIILSYNWNFGDGEIGTGKIVTHTYTLAGNYMVILNVTNSLGEWDIESKQITVKPKPQPVGGHALPININIHESNSLTFQIGLALSLPGAMAVTIILIRRRNKTLKWKH
jgi:plastocyanin